MKVISADSGAAILDEKYEPVLLVACAAVLVEPPYRQPSMRIAEPLFKEVEPGCEVIVHEAELCRNLLDKTKADVIHLDMTLGGISIEELSPIELTSLLTSKTGRKNILKILPRLRRVAGEIQRLYSIDMLAIGKESVPVRIAELTVAAEAILYASKRALETQQNLKLGLPHLCQVTITENRVNVSSLIAGERDVGSYALDSERVLTKVKLLETLNPVARGFRALEITPI